MDHRCWGVLNVGRLARYAAVDFNGSVDEVCAIDVFSRYKIVASVESSIAISSQMLSTFFATNHCYLCPFGGFDSAIS